MSWCVDEGTLLIFLVGVRQLIVLNRSSYLLSFILLDQRVFFGLGGRLVELRGLRGWEVHLHAFHRLLRGLLGLRVFGRLVGGIQFLKVLGLGCFLRLGCFLGGLLSWLLGLRRSWRRFT